MKSLDARRWLGLIMMGCGLLLAAIYLAGQLSQSVPQTSALTVMVTPATVTASPSPQPTLYFGPLVPTRLGATRPAPTAVTPQATATHPPTSTASATTTATATATATAAMTRTRAITSTRAATRTSAPQPSPTSAPAAATTAPMAPVQVPSSVRQRVCVGVPYATQAIAETNQALRELQPGWYLTWGTSMNPGGNFAQMVRVPRGQIVPKLEIIAQIAQTNPGALWLVGNEMDVIWQDNATPEQYAAAYHDVYATLKQADPSSRVAIGGITEPSPLRMQYLDRVLQVYRDRYGQEMPIDIWNVHNFILPEVRGSWGVDIPPGLTANSGVQRTIDDHDRLDIFKQQLIDFRRWMAQRGYQDKELIVSEYGILMYEDYGFDYERVRKFMLGSFDVMLNTTDASLGLPADGYRLVQRWCWYSLADTAYPTGNLADPNTGELTPLGRDFQAYLKR
jgi:hypothetical protein